MVKARVQAVCESNPWLAARLAKDGKELKLAMPAPDEALLDGKIL